MAEPTNLPAGLEQVIRDAVRQYLDQTSAVAVPVAAEPTTDDLVAEADQAVGFLAQDATGDAIRSVHRVVRKLHEASKDKTHPEPGPA